jgi:hypothetical protein
VSSDLLDALSGADVLVDYTSVEAAKGHAQQYGQMMNKAPGFGAPNYLTSGSIPTRLLGSAEHMEAGTEGPGLFFRGDPSNFFNVFNHGLIP